MPTLRVQVHKADANIVQGVTAPSFKSAVQMFRWYAENAPEELLGLVKMLKIRGEKK